MTMLHILPAVSAAGPPTQEQKVLSTPGSQTLRPISLPIRVQV